VTGSATAQALLRQQQQMHRQAVQQQQQQQQQHHHHHHNHQQQPRQEVQQPQQQQPHVVQIDASRSGSKKEEDMPSLPATAAVAAGPSAVTSEAKPLEKGVGGVRRRAHV
jgi:hypothetical protein